MAGAQGRRAGWLLSTAFDCCRLLPIAALLMATHARASSFDQQRAAVAGSLATQPEAAIAALLNAGIEEGKPTLAAADAAKWLQQNQPQDAMLLYQAGRAAELSGDWKGAAALYQQYLKRADLKSATADEALYAAYTLLIERLGDANGAYAFSRTDGHRLLVCPRARQFDAWFLDEAVRRQDATAVALRLRGCIEAGLPGDLLVARYDGYFRWLLSVLDTYLDHGAQVTQELYDSVKQLCDGMTFNDELKLRLDWAVSVKAYNRSLVGAEGDPKVKRAGAKFPKGGKKKPDQAAAGQAVVEKALDLEDVSAPVAEAEALLAKFPQYAGWVLTGWAGGGYGQYYRGDVKKFWPQETDAKLAPVVAALSRLTPFESAEVLNAGASASYLANPGVLEVGPVRDYVRATPALSNLRSGVPVLPREWNQLSQQEAQDLAPKLAPKLAPMADPTASLVRAIAAGAKDYDKVMAALLGPEVWRLGTSQLNGPYADTLWHYCGRPGGSEKREEWVAKSKAVAASLAAGDAKKEDPADKRVAAFRNLWNDFRSAQPKIPAVRMRAAAVLKFTPELVPELLKDPSPDAQCLVKEAIAAGMEDAKGALERDDRIRGVSVSAYSPWLTRLKQIRNEAPVQHPLEPALRAAVAERLGQGRIEPWLTMAWINLQFPDNNAEPVKLMQALLKSPAWASVPFEVQYAARQWFGAAAMTPAQIAWVDAADAKIVCKDLQLLTNTADAAAIAAALGKAIEGVKRSPVKINILGLQNLAGVTNAVFSDPRVLDQVLDVTDGLRFACDRDSEPFGERLLAYVTENPRPETVQRTASFLWSYGASEHYAGSLKRTLALAQSLLDDRPATALLLARVGLSVFSGNVAEHPRNWAQRDGGMAALKSLQGKAAMKLGLTVVPVAPTDPAYPVYKSQAEWQGGNEDSAWTLCSEHWDQLLPVHRELSMEYLFWLLQRTINTRDAARQEALIKALLAWAGEPGSPLSQAQQVNVEIAYADIAVQRGQLKEAREILTRTLQNKAYDGLAEQIRATLARVRVDRMAKNFEAALETVGEAETKAIPGTWTAIRYARAEVYYDMEEYNDAAADLDAILARDPDNAEATILRGKLDIKRQKLMEATEVEIGSASSQEQLAPGKRLKVTLRDPTLAVSGAGTEIEVSVWTTSGDREELLLRQFGDQKTKFRGEVDTALGAPKPGDHVLQVIGDDQILYGYSESFRRKMNNLAEKRGGPITVASDALLMASARKLLSEGEQRLADIQASMAELQKKQQGASSAAARGAVQAAIGAKAEQVLAEGASAEDLEARRLQELQKRLQEERARPGSPVYVRVVDPDRSRTAGIDEVAVSVESSSGDSISRVVLKETGPYTGWFEGSIPTRGAQAMAFAENSEPGRNPNMVISPVAEYPAWRPVSVKDSSPVFKVNLNDNVEVGELTITAREPGAKLKCFALRTGMNSGDMTTIAVYPKDQLSLEKPWNPSVVIMNDTDLEHTRDERSVYDLRQIEQQMESGWMSQQFAAGVAENVVGPSAAMTSSIPAKVQWKRQNMHHNAHVIYRFRGYFYEPADVTRRFKVELGPWTPPEVHPSVAHPAQYLLAVDGKIITEKTKPNLLEGGIELRKGVHRFEIWATGWDCRIGFGRSVKLLANLGNVEQLSECPDGFFDPAAFPKGVLAQRNGRATIAANADGTVFTVKFAPGSAARLIDLGFISQEGAVPALNKLALAKPDGKQVLPVAEDFAKLNKNDTLEILPGDRVAVRYVDDRFVTKGKEKHERFLNASFSNARLAFEFHEKRKDEEGNEFDYYENLLRFSIGASVLLTIVDPDMDRTPAADKVEVTIESKAGGKRKVMATETNEACGVFQVQVTPVAGAPAAETQVQVAEGDTLTAVYRDEENAEPGVPADRYASIRHARFTPPVLSLSHSTVTAIDPRHLPPPVALNEGFTPGYQVEDAVARMSAAARRAWETGKGTVRARWLVDNELRPVSAPPTNGFAAVLGRRLSIEVAAPFLALRAGSTVDVYLQTDAGRALAAKTNAPAAFDIRVPGTVRVEAGLLDPALVSVETTRGETPEIPIYLPGPIRRMDSTAGERFACSVPLIAWALPDYGVLTDEESAARRKAHLPTGAPGLAVRPGERVHIGVRFQDDKGAEQWATASTRVVTHPVLDVLEEDYRTAKTNAYVGEDLVLRVVDLGGDVSDRSDPVKVVLKARSGASCPVTLAEVDTHSGVFKGAVPLTYVKEGAPPPPADYDAKADGFPVVYGDAVEVAYADAKGIASAVPVSIRLGADGAIAPFSKKYEDSGMAMRTQFAMAESYLEVARNRRAAGDAKNAEHEFATARQLLAGVLEQFRDPETRAQAEYLLATLTLEDAEIADKPEVREARYRAALSRFMNVTGSYPDTLHASKAQFKIATVYEKLREPEIAAQEYVKLAYKYPESEYLATAMARLGSHFQRKAAEYEAQAKPQLEKTGDKDAEFEGKARQQMAVREYVKAASIFRRLLERFPSHDLAGPCGLRAGQSYMRAGDHRQAVKLFVQVLESEGFNGPEVRAEAMYWAGMCYESLREPMAAYSIYKRLTYDFPETKWSSYARAQLSQESLLRLETDLEIKRLEEGR